MLIPVYYSQANIVERQKRDLKTRLAILACNQHPSWPNKLPSFRFAMNTAACFGSGYSAAYLTFASHKTPYGTCGQLHCWKDSFRISCQGCMGPSYKVGYRVLVLKHTLRNTAKRVSAKLAPKRDKPYTVLEKFGPCTYRVAQLDGGWH